MPPEPDDFGSASDQRRVTALMSRLSDEDFVRHEPPPGLWDSLSERIASYERSTVEDMQPPRVASLASRRRGPGRSTQVLLAAAALVLVIATGALVVRQLGSSTPQSVATADLLQLEPLGRTSASARLISEDGTSRLVIDAKNMPPAPEGQSYELWLIDSEVTDPRSLGVVTGSEQVTVPASIDPKTHPIVDISLEPNDGDSGHSGHSLMRGTLS